MPRSAILLQYLLPQSQLRKPRLLLSVLWRRLQDTQHVKQRCQSTGRATANDSRSDMHADDRAIRPTPAADSTLPLHTISRIDQSAEICSANRFPCDTSLNFLWHEACGGEISERLTM
jgi:hypothetical protein